MMPTTTTKSTPKGSKYETIHLPENLTLISVMHGKRGKKTRLYFRCPSSSDIRVVTRMHTFSVNEDGTEPRCSCPSYEHRDYCGLTNEAERIAAMHRA